MMLTGRNSRADPDDDGSRAAACGPSGYILHVLPFLFHNEDSTCATLCDLGLKVKAELKGEGL